MDGVLHRRAALLVDEQGVVRGVSPAAAHERASPSLRNAILVPGGVDACALSALVSPAAIAPHDPVRALHALAATVCTLDAAELQRRAGTIFAAAVRAGVTTVALPHLVPQQSKPGVLGVGRPKASADVEHNAASPRSFVAAAYAAAAAEVGLRLTLLDVMALRGVGVVQGAADGTDAWQRCSHAGLEAAVRHLDALVRSLLERGTPLLSWGLLVPRPSLLGADALAALRLRLGHLPTVLVDAGERFAADGRAADVLGVHAPTLAGQCAGAGALDACCSWLTLGPSSMEDDCRAALARAGVDRLGPPPPPPGSAGLAQFDGEDDAETHGTGADPAPAWGTASAADPGPHDPAAWIAALLRRPPVMPGGPAGLPPARVAANALGLRGGSLRPDTWADYAVLRPNDGAVLPDTRAGVTRVLAGARGAAALQVAEVHVAGRRIYRAAQG